jgi:hydroxyacylglutathione hydrolase
MKRPVKRILIVLSVVFGILLTGAFIFYLKFSKATKAMTPRETGAINDSVWCIKDKFVNAFIFRGRTGYVMIDAGIGKNSFKNEIIRLGIEPEKITAILLTHTDGDHTGSIGLFKKAIIYMHKDEEQMINGKTGKTKYFKTRWKYGPYMLLNNNDTLNIAGLNIKIIHTPGHTPGSSCYIIGHDYLATGDNLIVKNGKYEHFNEMFNMNTLQQIESIKTLPDPSLFKYILTGHNGVVKNQ